MNKKQCKPNYGSLYLGFDDVANKPFGDCVTIRLIYARDIVPRLGHVVIQIYAISNRNESFPLDQYSRYLAIPILEAMKNE